MEAHPGRAQGARAATQAVKAVGCGGPEWAGGAGANLEGSRHTESGRIFEALRAESGGEFCRLGGGGGGRGLIFTRDRV